MEENENQEAICKLCEEIIIEGCSITAHFQCEGRYCKEAYEMYQEQTNDE